MEESLRLMEQRSREANECLDELRSPWDDEAAREIRGRYLNSYQDNDEEMLRRFNGQFDAIVQTGQALERAKGHRNEARGASEAIERHHKEAEEDSRSAERAYHLFDRYERTAQSLLPQVQDLINQANHACG